VKDIENMTIKEITDEIAYLRKQVEKKNTLFGYDVESLIAISYELQKNNITVDLLKDNLGMYGKGFKDGQEQVYRLIRKFNKKASDTK
jgi:hypothetical protein